MLNKHESPETGISTVSKPKPVVLLVEDDPINGKYLAMILSKVGYEAIHAGGASEALRLCVGRPGPIDLLVCDVILPQLNGFLLSRQLREVHPEMRVLFISGYPDDFLQTLAEGFGDFELVEKPFLTPSLIQKVRRALKDAPASRELQ